MKKIVREYLGDNYILLAKYKSVVMNRVNLFKNYWIDLMLFYKHSNVFKVDTFEKIESKIILDYHGIEKGFLHKDIRGRFAKIRVESLLKNLKIIDDYQRKSSQIEVSKAVLTRYYDYHLEKDINIEDYFPNSAYIKLLDVEQVSPVITKSSKEYFENIHLDFKDFSQGRRSVRSFKSDLIDNSLITDVIELSKLAPSVCNRQSVSVHYVKNYNKVQEILKIQGGLTGYSEKINQLMIVSSDRNYFYTVGERNQFYIDGGIYLMNLLYSLHYHGIAACCANWGKEISADLSIEKILNLKKSQKVICVVVIGYAEDDVKYTLSKRRNASEILTIIN